MYILVMSRYHQIVDNNENKNETEQGTPPRGVGSKESVYALRINTGFTARGPTNCPNHTIINHIQRA